MKHPRRKFSRWNISAIVIAGIVSVAGYALVMLPGAAAPIQEALAAASPVWRFTTETIPPTLTLTADRPAINYNESVTLTWTSTDGNPIRTQGGCDALPDFIPNQFGLPQNGSSVQSPPTSGVKTYMLTCYWSGGISITQSVNVTVAPPPNPIVDVVAQPLPAGAPAPLIDVWEGEPYEVRWSVANYYPGRTLCNSAALYGGSKAATIQAWWAVVPPPGSTTDIVAPTPGTFANPSAADQYVVPANTVGNHQYDISCQTDVSPWVTNSATARVTKQDAPPLPIYPPHTTVMDPTIRSVRLEWAAIPGARGYDVYIQKPTDGTFLPAPNGTNITATALNVDTPVSGPYNWYVDVLSGNDVFTPPTPPQGPNPPSGLAATAISQSRIDLRWTDNATNETGFELQRSRDNFATVENTTPLGANVTSTQSTGLIAGTLYYYRIRAVNANGPSAYSNTASAVTLSTAPSAPSSLSATVISQTQINLAWSNVANETGYELQRSLSSAFTSPTTIPLGVNVISYNNTGLTANTAYYYRVRAVNAGGPSAWTNAIPLPATTLPNRPAAPSGLTATAVSQTQINLTWTDNSNNEVNFRIERCQGAACTPLPPDYQVVGANVISYPDTGLTTGTSYSYRVRAWNSGGYSATYSNTATAVTQACLTDGTQCRTDSACPSIPGYNNCGGCCSGNSFISSNGSVMCSGSPVTQTYYSCGTAPPPTLPAAPSNLAKSGSGTTVNLAWTDNSNNETEFRIERATSTWRQIWVAGANATSTTDNAPGLGTYQYRVRACNAFGCSGYSNAVSAQIACFGTQTVRRGSCDASGNPTDSISSCYTFTCNGRDTGVACNVYARKLTAGNQTYITYRATGQDLPVAAGPQSATSWIRSVRGMPPSNCTQAPMPESGSGNPNNVTLFTNSVEGVNSCTSNQLTSIHPALAIGEVFTYRFNTVYVNGGGMDPPYTADISLTCAATLSSNEAPSDLAFDEPRQEQAQEEFFRPWLTTIRDAFRADFVKAKTVFSAPAFSVPEAQAKTPSGPPMPWTFTIAPPAANLVVDPPLTMSPPFPAQGDLMSFFGSVRNAGSLNAPASQTRLRLDVNNDGSWDVLPPNYATPALASNTSAIASWTNVWQAVPGTHRYEICADTTNTVTEGGAGEFEGDNCTERTFSISTVITLSASVTAAPFEGAFTLSNVAVVIDVSGTAAGPITYNIDCRGDGVYGDVNDPPAVTNVVDPYNSAADGHYCNYPSPGVYPLSVWVVRGTPPINAFAQTNVTVWDLPSVQLTANPAVGVPADGSTMLSWTVNSTGTPATCESLPAGPGETDPPGGWSVFPKGSGTSFTQSEVRGPLPGPATYTYRMHCFNQAGDRGVSVDVVVDPPTTPGTPTDPNPPDGATGISIYTDLDWADTPRATWYNVYFGSPFPVLIGSTPAGSPPPSFWDIITPLEYKRWYYWQIEACNVTECTMGPEWRFETEFPPVPACTITASPQFLLQNQTTTISWNCTGESIIETTFEAAPPPPLLLVVPASGATSSLPLTTTTYTVHSENIGGFSSANTTVGIYILKIKEVLPKPN